MTDSISVGRKYNRYLFEYRFGDAEWGLQIVATSPAEAKERIKALAWANYRGEIAAVVPVPGTGLIRGIAACFRKYTTRLVESLKI
jgi:hypothetical protein